MLVCRSGPVTSGLHKRLKLTLIWADRCTDVTISKHASAPNLRQALWSEPRLLRQNDGGEPEAAAAAVVASVGTILYFMFVSSTKLLFQTNSLNSDTQWRENGGS